jgi:guanylate kinase
MGAKEPTLWEVVSKTLDRPLLLVVSAPSGGGKTTLCTRLRAEFPEIAYSVSCTTRAPRGTEQQDVHYHFLSPDEFECRSRSGAFLEQAVVHGNRYGTLRSEVVTALSAGHDVLMDIDVQGAAQIRTAVQVAPAGDLLRRAFVDVFILPPSEAVLQQRLTGRGEDAPETIARRLQNARREMDTWRDYRYVIVNDDLDKAYGQLRSLVLTEHIKVLSDKGCCPGSDLR